MTSTLFPNYMIKDFLFVNTYLFVIVICTQSVSKNYPWQKVNLISIQILKCLVLICNTKDIVFVHKIIL